MEDFWGLFWLLLIGLAIWNFGRKNLPRRRLATIDEASALTASDIEELLAEREQLKSLETRPRWLFLVFVVAAGVILSTTGEKMETWQGRTIIVTLLCLYEVIVWLLEDALPRTVRPPRSQRGWATYFVGARQRRIWEIEDLLKCAGRGQ